MLQHGFLNMAHVSSSTEAEKRGKKTCAHFCYFTRILSRTQLLVSKVPDTMIWSYIYITPNAERLLLNLHGRISGAQRVHGMVQSFGDSTYPF